MSADWGELSSANGINDSGTYWAAEEDPSKLVGRFGLQLKHVWDVRQ